MRIVYRGGSRFSLEGEGLLLRTDPTPDATGEEAEVTIATLGRTPEAEERRARRDALAPAFVVDGPGEYEVGGTFIVGVPVPAGDGLGTAYSMDFGEIKVCHLGPSSAPPSPEVLAELGEVDVLLLPIGGEQLLGPSAAAEVVGALEPSLVLPMGYESADASVLQQFVQELGGDDAEPREALEVRGNQLPDEPTVVVLAAIPA